MKLSGHFFLQIPSEIVERFAHELDCWVGEVLVLLWVDLLGREDEDRKNSFERDLKWDFLEKKF